MRKYELTDETIEVGRKTLRRIRALRDLGDVKKGDLGGYIEKEDNLSHDGNCWVSDDAKVYGYAKVYGDVIISCSNFTYEDDVNYGNVEIFGDAKVYDSARIYDAVKIFRNAEIRGLANIRGNTRIPQDIKI
ncbi:hypothetical protein [Bartonella sp. TS82HLJMH]|uniref:hypothetical protein n=1 Tax=Bartonella sp. TS82HLJMH TaxID=3243577 RepID=UPI0035CE94DD